MENFEFRPGLTVKARIDSENVYAEHVILTNVRPYAVCGRGIIMAGDYQGKTYYNNYTCLMATFLFPECLDSSRQLSHGNLWSEHPPTVL